MRKDLIIEISRYKELMGLQIITESDFSKKFVYPSNGKKVLITSPYGMRFNPVKKKYTMHHGLDLRAKQGSNILAIADGVVRSAVFSSGDCGGTLRIDHGIIDGKKIYSRFCHVSKFLVKVGDEVKQGQIVAESGGTPGTKGDGTTNGPHIHFEFGINGSAVDPKQYYDEMSEWTGTPIEPEKEDIKSPEDSKTSDEEKDSGDAESIKKDDTGSKSEKHTWKDVKNEFEELKLKLKSLGTLKLGKLFPNLNIDNVKFDEILNTIKTGSKEKKQEFCQTILPLKDKFGKIITGIQQDLKCEK